MAMNTDEPSIRSDISEDTVTSHEEEEEAAVESESEYEEYSMDGSETPETDKEQDIDEKEHKSEEEYESDTEEPAPVKATLHAEEKRVAPEERRMKKQMKRQAVTVKAEKPAVEPSVQSQASLWMPAPVLSSTPSQTESSVQVNSSIQTEYRGNSEPPALSKKTAEKALSTHDTAQDTGVSSRVCSTQTSPVKTVVSAYPVMEIQDAQSSLPSFVDASTSPTQEKDARGML